MAGRNVRRKGRQSGTAAQPRWGLWPKLILMDAQEELRVYLKQEANKEASPKSDREMSSQRFRKYWMSFVQLNKLLKGCGKLRQQEGTCVPARGWGFPLKDSRQLMLLAACNVSFTCQEQHLYLYPKNAAIPPTESALGQVCPSYVILCIVSCLALLWIQ